MRKIGRKRLAILATFFVVSCGTGIDFDPDFYLFDSNSGEIVNRDNNRYSCFDPEIETRFACMRDDKIEELLTILRQCRLPPSYKKGTTP